MKDKIYVGASYYPEHWPKERWGRDIELMKEAGIDAVRIAELAWSFLEPEDGRFDFEWLDEFISMAYKEGIEVILGTPTETSPMWMLQKHPEVVATDGAGRLHGGRGRHCYNNTAFIGYVERLVGEMACHYGSNPAVIGWQIDNELRGARCYCEVCCHLYREWLKDRYGSLDVLNREWGTCFWSQTYSSWDEIRLPSEDQLTVSVSQILDHFRFASQSAVEHLNRQAAIIRRYAPGRFITHNTMGLYPWVNIYELSKELSFIGWDSYPDVDSDDFDTCMAHDLHRGAKGANFWVMEQRNGFFNYSDYNLAIEPGLVRLWAYQDIARGADGVIFYRWRSNRFGYEQNPNGILRHDGSPRRAYYEIQKFNKELAGFEEMLLGSRVDAPVAIIYSYDEIWALESHKQYRNFDYRELVLSYYKAIAGMGLTADLLDPTADLSKYPMVIAPCLMMVNEEIAGNLRSYAENGGCLILTVRSGIKTWANAMIDAPWPGLLADLAGIVVDEFEVLPDRYSNIVGYKEKEYLVKAWLDQIETKTAQSLASYRGKFYSGRTAVSRNIYGKGSVTYIGAMGNDELVRDILSDTAAEIGLETCPLPAGVFATKRVGEKGCLSFYININKHPVTVDIKEPGTDMICGGMAEGAVSIGAMDVLVLKRAK